MKFNKIFSAFMLIAAVAFTACNENPPVVGPTGGDDDKPNTTDTTVVDTTGWNIPAEAISVAKAREIAGALESGTTTGTKYYVMGYVKKLHGKHADGVANYGNAQFYMEDVKGANSNDDFIAYQVYGPNGEKITDAEAVAVGDFVVIYGELTNYNGTLETVGKGAAYIWKSSNPKLKGNGGGEDNPGEVTGDGSEEKPFTVTDVIALNNTKTGKYYVKAYIVGQSKGGSTALTPEFAAPFTPATDNDGNITDYNTNILIAATTTASDKAQVVPVQLPSGALRDGLNLIQNESLLGQEVLIYGSLEKYFGQAGLKTPTYAKIGDKELGTKPVISTGDEILNETLMTQASFDKFTTVNVKGNQVWNFSSQYGAMMSGFNNDTKATEENEDWFISPAMDLTGKSAVTLTFNHAFGPKGSLPVDKSQYTVWVSNDFNEDVTAASWTQITGITYGETAWGYVSAGNLAIPAENLKANCRIAWKYTCTDKSATWEVKEVVVK